MAEVNQSRIKVVNIHQTKIYVVKFDDTKQLWYVEMRGDRCAERAEFETHVALAKETSEGFRKRLEQNELDGVW